MERRSTAVTVLVWAVLVLAPGKISAFVSTQPSRGWTLASRMVSRPSMVQQEQPYVAVNLKDAPVTPISSEADFMEAMAVSQEKVVVVKVRPLMFM